MNETKIKKRIFNRIIVKTNSSCLTPERFQTLKVKIKDPNYINYAIEKLADNISKALLEGYINTKKNN